MSVSLLSHSVKMEIRQNDGQYAGGTYSMRHKNLIGINDETTGTSNIATALFPVLLIDGRAVELGDGCSELRDVLNHAYSKIAPIDDGLSHVDIDSFESYFDVHEGVAFPTIDLYDSNDGHDIDILILTEPTRIDELPAEYRAAATGYLIEHEIDISATATS